MLLLSGDVHDGDTVVVGAGPEGLTLRVQAREDAEESVAE